MTGANILIVEDESIIAEELRRIVIRLGYKVVAVAHRYEEAVALIEQQVPDLVLLDIGLDYSKNDGIDLGAMLKDAFGIPFIYITANTDVATVTRAKFTEPAAYIPKPFNPDIIYTNIEMALHRESTQVARQIPVKTGSKKTLVDIRRIVFLKADNIYTELHTADNKTYVLRESLKSLLLQFEENGFVQIHRSYAVNLSFVESYTADYVYATDHKLPLSDSYKKPFMDALKQ
ncbi:MAG: LytR/AlgR family response regulator transcription factor [Cytophagaceae bacterium]